MQEKQFEKEIRRKYINDKISYISVREHEDSI